MWEVQVILIFSITFSIPFITHISKKRCKEISLREHSTPMKLIFFILLYSLWICSIMPILVLTDLIDGTQRSLHTNIIFLIMPFLCFFTIANYEYIFFDRQTFHYFTIYQLIKVVFLRFWILFIIVFGLMFFFVINGSLLWFGSAEIIDKGGQWGVFFVGSNIIAIYFFWKSLNLKPINH